MKAGVAQNYDLKTMSKLIGSSYAAVVTLGLGAVPTGMKRYVTMVRANNVAGNNLTLFICSGTGSASISTSTLAIASQKYAVQLEAGESDEFPKSSPNPERPLFSIAAGAYVNAVSYPGNVRLFLQYYDQ
jgi:hypothetical protein